jgi:hypothetical protein
MLVPSDLLHLRCLAKARYILVALAFAPCVIGRCDFGDVVVRELLARAVYQRPELAGIDEQHLAATVAELAAGILVAREKPQARRNLRRIEKLAR